jgi:hypothetical protein
MACTHRASRKRVEDAEIFQVLEENTNSDVTIFSSEEDEDGNEHDSDEDGQLDDNSETTSHFPVSHLSVSYTCLKHPSVQDERDDDYLFGVLLRFPYFPPFRQRPY